MGRLKGRELQKRCDTCDIKLIVAKENDKLIVAVCPRCQCESYFVKNKKK